MKGLELYLQLHSIPSPQFSWALPCRIPFHSKMSLKWLVLSLIGYQKQKASLTIRDIAKKWYKKRYTKSFPKSHTDGILCSLAAEVHLEEPWVSTLPLTGGWHESVWENSSPQPAHSCLPHRKLPQKWSLSIFFKLFQDQEMINGKGVGCTQAQGGWSAYGIKG